MDNPIIQRSDILEFWSQMDKNMKQDKLDPYILRAQQSEFKNFLGPPLYFDFITDPDSEANQTLFNGTVYEFEGNDIFFEGIRPYLCALSFSRVISNINISVGRANVTAKDTEQSTPHSNAIIQTRAREVKSEGLRLQEEARQFLDQNQDVYPLWQKRVDDSANRDTSLFGQRVPRHRQR